MQEEGPREHPTDDAQHCVPRSLPSGTRPDRHLRVEERESHRVDMLPALPPGLKGSKLRSTHRNPGLRTPSPHGPVQGQPPR